jgi:adenosine kinase
MAVANPLQGVLLGLGNPLLDISASVDSKYLEKYGLKPSNAILCDEKVHLPMYDELAAMPNAQYIAGGAAQNTIRVAQWMLQVDGATGYTGCVGKDKFSTLLRQAAEGDKVTLHYLEDAKVPTGTCACCVVDKDRSLVANLSAANHFKVEHLKTSEMTAVLAKAKIIYAEGYFITSGFSSIQYAAEHALTHNKIMSLNLSAPFLSEFFSEQLLSLLPYVDYLFGNESEAQAFAKKQNYKDLTIPAIALEISKMEKKKQSCSCCCYHTRLK